MTTQARADTPQLRRWQQAVITITALYPAVLTSQLTLGPVVRRLPLPLGVLVGVLPVVIAMTYWLMPLAKQILGPFFASSPDRGGERIENDAV